MERMIGDYVHWINPEDPDYEGRYVISDIISAEQSDDGLETFMLLDDSGEPYFVNESEIL